MPRDQALSLLQQRRVAPSILSADFSRLGEQVGEVLAAGARIIHVDVMDGHFVPPITMGPLAVAALRERVGAAGAVLDVHLMIERPERLASEFAVAGADIITVHAEATHHVHHTIAVVREAGVAAGLAICPATPVGVVSEVVADLDLLLCMTVNPGWGGQEFIAASVDKVRRMRTILGAATALEVDGGIDTGTAGRCAEAGATVFVAGSAVFGSEDPARAYSDIVAAAGAG